MALCITRLLCRRNLGPGYIRSLYTSNSLGVSTSKLMRTTASVCETYDEKNQRLKRPMSPHLTIYQVQLTSLLSISHRVTGMILSSYAVVLGSSTLLLPGGTTCLIESISSLCLPAVVLFGGKALLAFPATYHFFNGIRHLLWDLGKFLTIKDVYSTGYAVVALGVISAIVLAGL